MALYSSEKVINSCHSSECQQIHVSKCIKKSDPINFTFYLTLWILSGFYILSNLLKFGVKDFFFWQKKGFFLQG